MTIIEQIYYDWLTMIALNDVNKRDNYSYLLNDLYNKPFYTVIRNDENRIKDIISFRHRFAYEFGIQKEILDKELNRQPNILELMISLSFYCYENITFSNDISYEISMWFNEMLNNLGLSNCTNDNYDQKYVDAVLNNFINRDYAEDGTGSLFKVNDQTIDMRNVEIWYQMNKYINEKIIF